MMGNQKGSVEKMIVAAVVGGGILVLVFMFIQKML